jgi:hypothetical protein
LGGETKFFFFFFFFFFSSSRLFLQKRRMLQLFTPIRSMVNDAGTQQLLTILKCRPIGIFTTQRKYVSQWQFNEMGVQYCPHETSRGLVSLQTKENRSVSWYGTFVVVVVFAVVVICHTCILNSIPRVYFCCCHVHYNNSSIMPPIRMLQWHSTMRVIVWSPPCKISNPVRRSQFL